MALVEIDHVLGTLEKELGVCLTLRRRQEARGIYGVMVRLALVHTLKPETLRMIFSKLRHLPEAYDHAEHIMALATPDERQQIEIAQAVTQTIRRASVPGQMARVAGDRARRRS